MPGSGITNPYLSRKVASKPVPTTGSAPVAVMKVADKKPSGTISKATAKTPAPVKVPLKAPVPATVAPLSSGSLPLASFEKKRPVSLKMKLKKQLEDLKRQKLLQKQMLDEKKRRKAEKKRQKKLEAHALKLRQQEEKHKQLLEAQKQKESQALESTAKPVVIKSIASTTTSPLPNASHPTVSVDNVTSGAVSPPALTSTPADAADPNASTTASLPTPQVPSLSVSMCDAAAMPPVTPVEKAVAAPKSTQVASSFVNKISSASTPAAPTGSVSTSRVPIVPSVTPAEKVTPSSLPVASTEPVTCNSDTTPDLQYKVVGPLPSTPAHFVTSQPAGPRFTTPDPLHQVAPGAPNPFATNSLLNPTQHTNMAPSQTPMATTFSQLNPMLFNLPQQQPYGAQNFMQPSIYQNSYTNWSQQNQLFQHPSMYQQPINSFAQPVFQQGLGPMVAFGQPNYLNSAWNPAFAALLSRPVYSQHQQHPPAPVRRPRAPRSSNPTPKLTAERLTPTPCRAPSPYAVTHRILHEKLLLVKAPGQKGYGMNVQNCVKSALVRPDEWPSTMHSAEEKSNIPVGPTNDEAKAADTAEGLKTTNPIEGSQSALSSAAVPIGRVRRRRMFFAVLQILNPDDQNACVHDLKRKEAKIMEGDIVLTIGDKTTAGLTFADACGLFQSQGKVDAAGFTLCEITVARKIPTKPTPPVIPRVALPSVSMNSGEPPIGPSEILALCGAVISALADWKQVLGRRMFVIDDNLVRLLNSYLKQSSRSLESWRSAWSQVTHRLQYQMMGRALDYWQKQWQLEPEPVRGMKLLTDAQRSELRARPRPAKGCRCGSKDHRYVNNPEECPLYSNLWRLRDVKSDEEKSPAKDATRISKEKPARESGVVEAAFKERVERLKAEESAQENEASFVGRMEDIQLTKCRQAIFAPGLTAIVLSAVVELEPEFRNWRPMAAQSPDKPEPAAPGPELKSAGTKGDVDSDDDDDDDIPLTSLGKRDSGKQVSSAAHKKKARIEPIVERAYIAKLLRFISDRWGHVFQEPSDEDYAWYV